MSLAVSPQREANVAYASALMDTEIGQRNARKDSQEVTARWIVASTGIVMTLLLGLAKDEGVFSSSASGIARGALVATVGSNPLGRAHDLAASPRFSLQCRASGACAPSAPFRASPPLAGVLRDLVVATWSHSDAQPRANTSGPILRWRIGPPRLLSSIAPASASLPAPTTSARPHDPKAAGSNPAPAMPNIRDRLSHRRTLGPGRTAGRLRGVGLGPRRPCNAAGAARRHLRGH